MYTNVNLAAPIGALLLLGNASVLLVTSLVILISLLIRKFSVTRWSLLVLGVIAASYLLLLLGFSFASRTYALARGQEKHFCELDCHLAYSIADIHQTEALSSPTKNLKANGVFYVVTLKTRFDETTIGPSRGNGPLRPNPRSIAVLDADGHRYSPATEAQALLDSESQGGTPIETPLRPSESYTTVYVFDLPRDIHSPTVLLNESDWVTHFIIGHENSLGHKQTTLQL